MYSPDGGRLNIKPDGTKRVASGGVKAGLPLILTGGRARHEAFKYNFTDPGKFKKKKKFGETPLHEQCKPMNEMPGGAIKEKFHFVIPPNVCIDCNRIDRPRGPGSGGFINMIPIEDETYAGLGLIPGRVVVTCWCQDCVEGHEFAKKNMPIVQGDDLPEALVLPESLQVPPEEIDEWRLNMMRHNRMQRNMIDYLRNNIDNPTIYVDKEAFYKERGLK